MTDYTLRCINDDAPELNVSRNHAIKESEKRGGQKSEMVTSLFVRTLAVCVSHPAIPCRSLPSVARYVSPDEVVKHVLFRFLVQRYCFYLTYANFLAKKCSCTLSLEKLQTRKATPAGIALYSINKRTWD